jgi:GNAT superfamily N-acetyltransferase
MLAATARSAGGRRDLELTEERHDVSMSDLLEILDGERRLSGSSSDVSGLVRECSLDGSECRIVFSYISPSQLVDAVRDEQARARSRGYALEWKVYGHDPLPRLAETLAAAGFEAGEVETVLALEVDDVTWRHFEGPAYETRTVHDEAGLAEVATISRQIGRRHVEAESNELGLMLRERADALSIYVAYVAGEPVSCGRIQYGRTPGVAELTGGRTVTTHRRQGLFTAVVAERLREAATRGCRYVFVDALPTSEQILTRLGFTALTRTQPFTYEP